MVQARAATILRAQLQAERLRAALDVDPNGEWRPFAEDLREMADTLEQIVALTEWYHLQLAHLEPGR